MLRISDVFVPGKDEPHRSYASKHLFTDDKGRFTAHGLLPGRYMLLSVRAGGVPLTFRVAPDADGGQTIELRSRSTGDDR